MARTAVWKRGELSVVKYTMLHLGKKPLKSTTNKQNPKKTKKKGGGENKNTQQQKSFHREGGGKEKGGESREIVQNAIVLVVFEVHCSTDKGQPSC